MSFSFTFEPAAAIDFELAEPPVFAHLVAHGFRPVERAAELTFVNVVSPALLASQRPFILCPVEDSCDVHRPLTDGGATLAGHGQEEDLHQLATAPGFLAIFNNRCYRDFSYLERPTIGGKYHNTALARAYLDSGSRSAAVDQYLRENPPIVFSPVALSILRRAEPVFWDLGFSPLARRLRPFADAPLGEVRDIDVFCSLKANYRHPLVAWHRRCCLECLRDLRGPTTKAGEFISVGDEYRRDLARSKICVSPWGFGEWCFRDVESLLAGCVTIKPECSWVYNPIVDLFQANPSFFVSCRLDFADLPERIAEVLSDYERFRARALEGRAFLLDKIDHSRNIEHFVRRAFLHLRHRP